MLRRRCVAAGNLYVKSLPPTSTTSDLSSLFARFGTVTSARVMTDPLPPHRSREFGFVSFADEASAGAARAEMDGREVGGRRITVRVL